MKLEFNGASQPKKKPAKKAAALRVDDDLEKIEEDNIDANEFEDDEETEMDDDLQAELDDE